MSKSIGKEIIPIFQNYLATGDTCELDKLNLSELIPAAERLNIRGINPKFMEVIQTRIWLLEQQEARRYESRIRAWNLLTGLVLGLAIASIAGWLFS